MIVEWIEGATSTFLYRRVAQEIDTHAWMCCDVPVVPRYEGSRERKGKLPAPAVRVAHEWLFSGIRFHSAPVVMIAFSNEGPKERLYTACFARETGCTGGWAMIQGSWTR